MLPRAMLEELIVGPPLTATDLLKLEAEAGYPSPGYLEATADHALKILRQHGLMPTEEELP